MFFMTENSISKEKDTEVIVAGINRFFNEGYIVWSKANLEKLFKGNIDNTLLEKWEMLGFIKVLGNESKYIEILSRIS
jgi:hypothetical protein